MSAIVVQEREAVEGSDRSRVHALETLNTKLTSELEEVKREQDLKIVECETLKHDLKAVMQRLGESNLLIYCVRCGAHLICGELGDRTQQTLLKHIPMLSFMFPFRCYCIFDMCSVLPLHRGFSGDSSQAGDGDTPAGR